LPAKEDRIGKMNALPVEILFKKGEKKI